MGSRILWLAVALGPALGAGCTGEADDDDTAPAGADGDVDADFDDDGALEGFDACAATQPEDQRFAGAMDALENEVAEWFVPGGAMAIVWGGEVRHVGVTGSRRLACAPMTERTMFRAGVLTEMVTAAAILRSPPGQALDLDAPVSRFVPELALVGGGEDEILLRHVLTHGSGYGGGLRLEESCASMLGWLADGQRAPAVARPGVIHQYNAANYTLAGLALERGTGWSFEYAAWRRILDPLQMTHTSFRPTAAVHHQPADGHDRTGRSVAIDATDCGAEWAGLGMVTTIGDLARFVAMLQRGGDGVLEREDVALILGQDGAENFYPGRTTGLGLERIHGRGETPDLVVRQGAADGFAQALVMVPDYDLAVIVLMNAEWARPQKVAFEAVRVFLGIEPAPDFVANPASWAGLRGTYHAIESIDGPPRADPRRAVAVHQRTLEVARVQNTLLGRLDRRTLFVLRPALDEDVFVATVKGQVHRLRFWRDETDEAVLVSEPDAASGPPFERLMGR